MKVSISELKKLSLTPLMASNITEFDAQIVFNHLLDEELLGKHSHGFIRMPAVLRTAKSFKNNSSCNIEEPTAFAVRYLFSNTLGLVAGYNTALKACDIANEKGIGMASAIGYSGTTGALGYYGRLITERGFIGIISCSSEYAVAPWGGKDAILGTNPICIAFPNGDNPIIVDFATAAMTYGDLMLAVKEGRKVPYGVVLDAEGNPTQDPDDANNGCQLPMAGHKGYALGLALEILSGLFIGAKSGKDAVTGSDGILVLALKPDMFVNSQVFTDHLSALINEIKMSALAAESDGIRIPGEGAVKKIKEGRESGFCDVPEAVYKELQ